jgi:hypothetical protein
MTYAVILINYLSDYLIMLLGAQNNGMNNEEKSGKRLL